MKIDNDFLTLLDLTIKLAMAKANRPVVAYPAERERDRVNIENMTLKRDALVAKINAADDARRKEDLNRVAAMFKLADWHDRKRTVRSPDVDAAVAKQTADLTDATQKTNDALAEVLKTIAALNEKPIIHEGRTIEIAGQAKDAAPAPSQPKGHQVSVRTVTDAVEFVDRYGKPDSITIEHDPMTWIGGIVFVLRWNVSPKDADGEGR
jgi:hypothetical protein